MSDTPFLDALPTLNTRTRHAPAKGLPPALVKEAKAKSRERLGEEFRAAVWKRDGGKSRATGKKLSKSAIKWDERGEVDHVIDRSLAPERIYDVGNGILLSAKENRLKKTACPNAPEHRMFSVTGPDDRSKPQTFTWRDADGKIIKTRMG